MAVSIDSKGFELYYEQHYLDIGVLMTGVTKKYFKQHDRQRKNDQQYSAKPERMVKRSKRKLENMQAEWKKEITDKMGGHTYDSGKAEEKEDPATTASNKQKQGNSKTTGAKGFCNTCKNYGHQRVSSKQCRANPKSKYYEGTKGTCVVSVLTVYCA